MIKLLVIADDFTGAMDTGVQFRTAGTLIRIGGQLNEDLIHRKDLQVLIVDAETRHMSPQDAYHTVYSISAAAAQAGVPCIYKKTDSALRGNIGSELTAMLRAAERRQLHFIPAFPRMARYTREGIHYIGSTPVAESVFGADPFEPVRLSDVREIIASQSNVPSHVVGQDGQAEGEGIFVYDAQTEADLRRIAGALRDSGELCLLAGCAGFASVLPALLELESDSSGLPQMDPRLLTVCGSVNPITLGQLDAAERAGVPRIRLTPRQKLEPGWLESGEGRAAVAGWLEQIRRADSAIIDCGGGTDCGATDAYAREIGMSGEQTRQRVSAAMGEVLRALLDLGLERTILLTGGDTLLAFMAYIGQDTLAPLGELVPGVVLSQARYRGRTYNLISKSGGFGAQTLLADLADILHQSISEEETIPC